MKSPIAFWMEVADDLSAICCVDVTRDKQQCLSRFEHEGLSFLSITLASFGSDFQKSLDQGYVARSSFTGFQRKRGLPRFLSGFLERVFDPTSGHIVDNPCIDSIFAIRQLCYLFSKIDLPCSIARVKKAIKAYVDCELEMKGTEINEDLLRKFHRTSRILFARVFSQIDGQVYRNELIPRHGPGATADSIRGNGKYRISYWTNRLERSFPYGDYCLPNQRYADKVLGVHFHEPGSEIPVKVITVPKTLKTPRIIAEEPAAMQYAQQALREPMYRLIEEDSVLREMMGLFDQVPNQRLALAGSLDGSLATLDLSEASDRVSNQVVRVLFSDHKHLFDAVDSCRSRTADVPGFGRLRLAKFASMGSALCFPVESMVFLTIVLTAIAESQGVPVTRRWIKSMVGSVRVFGDDLIIPKTSTQSVIGLLEAFGFKINLHKSFWGDSFRESCGKEYFRGHDVSVVKVRRMFPASQRDTAQVISLVSLRNNAYMHGLWRTANRLDLSLVKLLRGAYPTVHPTSPVLGRHTLLDYQVDKICVNTQAPRVRGYVVSPVLRRDMLEGPEALLKCFHLMETSSDSAMPMAVTEHLTYSGRPASVSIRKRYGLPY